LNIHIIEYIFTAKERHVISDCGNLGSIPKSEIGTKTLYFCVLSKMSGIKNVLGVSAQTALLACKVDINSAALTNHLRYFLYIL
jgi:hypothetical protein